MINLEYADDYRCIFEKAGLACLDDFFNMSAGELINKNHKRNVLAFTLEIDNHPVEFFMKRFINPHFKDMLFTFRNFGRICSQAAAEYKNTEILLQNGIRSYKPVCFGEEINCSIEKRSFFITEKLNSCCLADFIAQKWPQFSQQQKDKLITSLAEWIRKIHDAKISLPDLYVWHIFLTHTPSANGDEYEFSIIDLHRMRINANINDRRIRNLGAFHFSLIPKYFDNETKTGFLEAYLPEVSSGQRLRLQKKIENRSEKLRRKRRMPDY